MTFLLEQQPDVMMRNGCSRGAHVHGASQNVKRGSLRQNGKPGRQQRGHAWPRRRGMRGARYVDRDRRSVVKYYLGYNK
jgi:hypothetical protein